MSVVALWLVIVPFFILVPLLLGIFVYPALYYFVGKIGRFEQRRELKKQEENA